MNCPRCLCPGFAPLFNFGICFNSECVFYDKAAMEKADWDGDNYTANGASIIDINDFLDHRHSTD